MIATIVEGHTVHKSSTTTTTTTAAARRKILTDVLIAELLLNGVSFCTVPCPHVYQHEPITDCPYCHGSGSVRYGIEELWFEGEGQ